MDVLRRHLDAEQLEIALASDTSLIVVAGPGSGKTRLLTQVAAYQARKTEPANHRVLCLTFSVQATREMQTRLVDPSLGVSRRRLHVANFHQLGSQILAAYGHHAGWPRDAQIADSSDTDEVIEEILRDLHLPGLSVFDAKQAIGNLRNNRTPASQLPAASLIRLADVYRERMAELRLRDYDDLILHTIDLLDANPDIAEIIQQTYGYIVVDELQDTSGHQLELVARLSNEGRTPIFAVADNDQMIYAWRDAREENLAEWQERFDARRVALLGNYRCPDLIVRAANALISHNPRPTADLGEPYSRVTDRPGELFVARAANDWAEGDVVGDIVCEQIATGVRRGKIAILAANRFPFDRIGQALDEREVPYVRVGDDPFASRTFGRALRAGLVLSVSPDNDRAQARLMRLLGVQDGSQQATEALATLTGLETPSSLVTALRQLTGLDADNEDVVHAMQVIALGTRNFGAESLGSIGRRLALEWHRLNAELHRESDAVKMMTTFAAKGLEYDVVILPRFGEGQVPYSPKGRPPDWPEERRKVYVALTRAERTLYFVYSSRNPSAFLLEIPADLLTIYRPIGLRS